MFFYGESIFNNCNGKDITIDTFRECFALKQCPLAMVFEPRDRAQVKICCILRMHVISTKKMF